MKIWRSFLIIGLVNISLLGLAQLTIANTDIKIEGDSPFTAQELNSGAIKVVVTYNPLNNNSESADPKNFFYQIYYQDQKKVEASDFTQFTGEVYLKDLDNNGVDEVVVRVFTGGAHCCTNTIIYTWQEPNFIKTETDLMDGSGGTFEDLNGDGKLEFLSYDNSFLYKFSSYAGSFPPTLIYSFQNGHFQTVTRKYPKKLRETLQEMYKAIREGQKKNYEINGILAGYVAQKILLGEYEEGWQFMLANYDRISDWGLVRYDSNGKVIDKYVDYPTALKAFLIEEKYLDQDGKPLF
ncbi:hypothetical protein [Gloeothece verrucosa]|uniref:Uncharacterized protein n=1 Tax=Gloeothece verrucosa (strain PCC 7822) TaxID=497965 RepID=E0UF28_GLOV7|nr:hypothetical protein [Gloeothece verrucosa]ADN14280.1 conserved hypothetical protein [Gloeothece verrucosa PCC 7822]